MSYGYPGQGGQYPSGNRPPTSFGAPPGAPSAPGGHFPQQNSNFGYSNAPRSSMGMPQPFSNYPPSFPGQNSSQYPQPSFGCPVQGFQGSAYPQAMPQPCYDQPSYPKQQPGPYPNLEQSYPHQPMPQNYPRQPSPFSNQSMPHQNYPSQPTSYPQQSMSHNYSYQQQSYPTQRLHSDLGNGITMASSTHYSGGNSFSGGTGPLRPTNFQSKTQSSPRYVPKLSPTAVPYPDFDPRADAEVLRKAMKGFGTDEKAIINVLANRSNLQRQEIALQFKTLYGKDLIKDLKSETSGNFEKLLVAMMTPLPQYYAKELHEAMSGIGTDECVLIEVLCTMSNHEIRVISQAYEQMYGQSLEDDLRSDTSGNFKRLMVSLCCGNRDESFDVDPSAAADDARALLQAGELNFGTDESTFNAILVQRNVPQLKQIFHEYQNITGHSIEEAIDREFSGDIRKGLLAIVKCVNNRAEFFAEQLYKSMKGAGTDDRRLIRLVVTRSEIDMGEIKEAFNAKYGESLENCISSDCSGDYKKCLLALIS